MGLVAAGGTARSSTPAARQWRAWAALIRWDRTLAAALYTVLGAYLADQPELLAGGRVLRATLTVGLVVAFGFAINDCSDVAVDALARPERPLPSGRISGSTARRASWALAIAAVVLGSTLGPGLGAFAAATVCLSTAYSFWLKNTLLAGNASMALLVSAVPVYGALAVGSLPAEVMAVAAMTFPYFCAQEILYTVEDHRDDRQAGLRTTAVRLGPARALLLVRLLMLLYAIAAAAPWAIGIAGGSYLAAILACSVFPTLAVAAWLSYRMDPDAVRRAVKASRAIWLSTVVPLLLLK